MTSSFPPGFRWGVATSAFQIEGATTADGRGPSIWDTFATLPGAVAGGDTGEPAAEHYHRLPEDLALLTGLGVDAYRFSVSWPRVQPSGRGRPERRGLDFYRRLVEGLRDKGIEPFLTLYHWDLPQALEDEGGWRSRDTAERFAEYAVLVHEELGDVVDHWTTLNEPYPCAIAGYAEGRHAPGAREGHGALAAAHHLLLGHGLAVRAMRARATSGQRFGVVLNQSPALPVTRSDADIAAAERQDTLLRRQFTDPLFGGRYAPGLTTMFDGVSDFSFRHDGDLETIGQPLDYLGVNYYYRLHVADAPHREPDPARRTAADIGVDTTRLPDVPRTGMGWPVEPDGLTEALVGLHHRYPGLPPVYVTENGCVYPDIVDERGVFADEQRIAYLREHIEAARAAMAAGVDLRGYFCWSLLDNFEWAHGYKHRFGLVHVDYPTQRRTPRASYHWYRDHIAACRTA
ncbi:GH1 family beta-glucosidase [Amycolatopsis sp. 195334CR]|uniref:GH1 family beta-glucosidase n=1 Tax=Amycolatopsis sp. 195334CR TaxID=2814588 RepID=UPI001A8D3279|nr:GH1 family beta-glucosidase [Amycolatopsis sp. 195334CR]MBN6039038.1 beta-glucosidase [Amycolatopsis sp. 195334CR]